MQPPTLEQRHTPILNIKHASLTGAAMFCQNRTAKLPHGTLFYYVSHRNLKLLGYWAFPNPFLISFEYLWVRIQTVGTRLLWYHGDMATKDQQNHVQECWGNMEEDRKSQLNICGEKLGTKGGYQIMWSQQDNRNGVPTSDRNGQGEWITRLSI